MSGLPLVRLIAMYLPQFHPIPENDQWWGEGFTEWTNVCKSKPRFPGHYQPHVPGKLGYYDLRDPAVRSAQAELARSHGIHGFCYYHYWFNGKRLLETPFNEVLKSGEPDFPFCLCWANENWTRRWDGADQEVLMAQRYSDDDSLSFINELTPAFCDDRYIRVNGKPLLLVYKTAELPNPKRTTDIWREAMHEAGIGDLFLVRVENFIHGEEPSPEDVGFDAAMEFAPYWGNAGKRINSSNRLGMEGYQLDEDVVLMDYDQCMRNMLCKPEPDYKLFRGIFPTWDNTARRKKDPLVFVNASPEKYAFWLSRLLSKTVKKHTGDERLIFINAWNEWGEGCHLEPDNKYGMKFLEATRNTLEHFEGHKKLLEQLIRMPGLTDELKTQIYDRLNVAAVERDLLDRDILLEGVIKDVYVKEKLIDDLSLEKQRLGQVNESLVSEITKLKDQVNYLGNSVVSKQNSIDMLLGSMSWKLTKPLRRIHAKLLGNDNAVDNIVANAASRYATPHDYYRAEQLVEKASKVNEDFDVIVFPVIDWHFRFQRPQHISCELARKGHRVYYLTITFASEWDQPGFVMLASPQEGVYVVQLNCSLPHPLNVYQDSPSEAQATFLAGSLSQLCDVCRIRNFATIVDLPFWEPVVNKMPEHVMVYDCMDHHAGFSTNTKKMLDMEKGLMHRADLVITTSQRLSDIVSREVANTVIRNGAEVRFFSTSPSELAIVSRRPVVGYFGAISEWFDIDLVIAAAHKYPDWEFVLVGSTSGCDVSQAEKLLNIRFVGEIPYADLPSYLHAFDVCIIPFKLTELTLCTNPVKVYEYLSAGKPVVATAMPELQLIADQLHVTNSKAEFLGKMKVAMDERNDQFLTKGRIEWALQHDWSARAAQLESAIRSQFEKKGLNL